MYDEILLPTDGSPAAAAALDHALDLASTYGARLHALYVVDVNAYATVETGGDMVLQALEREGETAVDKVREAAADAGVEVTTTVETGNPYREILGYIEDEDVGLVVMGTHGRRGLERFLLGSVTERVVRSADVPVLTVRETEEEEEAEE